MTKPRITRATWICQIGSYKSNMVVAILSRKCRKIEILNKQKKNIEGGITKVKFCAHYFTFLFYFCFRLLEKAFLLTYIPLPPSSLLRGFEKRWQFLARSQEKKILEKFTTQNLRIFQLQTHIVKNSEKMDTSNFISFGEFYSQIRSHFSANIFDFEEFKRRSSGSISISPTFFN